MLTLGRRINPSFIVSSDYTRNMFLSDGSDNPSVNNIDFYPRHLSKGDFYFINYGSSDVAEDALGNHPEGWIPNKRNKAIVDNVINSFPKRMMENLMLVPGKDGVGIPIAGTYFTKLMDHEPGTIEPLSCLITDENGQIPGLIDLISGFAPSFDVDGGTYGED